VDHTCVLPDDPLGFIRECVGNRRVFWTYHVHMRLRSRGISRQAVYESIAQYQVIEAYPQDKYLPSYLVWTSHESHILHVLFAVDIEGHNVRVVTAYHPGSREWIEGFKRRKPK
jgi:hypothetical protein